MPYFADYYPAISFPVASGSSRGVRDARRGTPSAVNSHFTLRVGPALVTIRRHCGKLRLRASQ
jgi:hypothetical protein